MNVITGAACVVCGRHFQDDLRLEVRTGTYPLYAHLQPCAATVGITATERDHQYQAVEMRHGTSTGTNPLTNTGNPSDGSGPRGSGGGDRDTGNDSGQ